MKAIILEAPKRIRLSFLPTPKRRKNEVLIEPKTVGICGTDVSVYSGNLPVKYPIVLGHEYCAEIVDIDDNIYGLKQNDLVVGEGSWGCGACFFCLHGQFQYCEKQRQLGRTVNGVMSEFATVPGATLHNLPKGISLEEAQSIVTIATGLRAVHRGNVAVGNRLLILGSGHAGLILTQLCRIAGASLVVVTGTRRERLKIARKLGADETVTIDRKSWEDKVKKIFGDEGVDIVIDAAGRRDSLNQAIDFVKRGGTIIEFGTYTSKPDRFEAPQIYKKEITIIGSKGGAFEYEKAIDLVHQKRVKISPLISHRISLKETAEIFKQINEGTRDILRAVIEI